MKNYTKLCRTNANRWIYIHQNGINGMLCLIYQDENNDYTYQRYLNYTIPQAIQKLRADFGLKNKHIHIIDCRY